jgi:hypothetical protein
MDYEGRQWGIISIEKDGKPFIYFSSNYVYRVVASLEMRGSIGKLKSLEVLSKCHRKSSQIPMDHRECDSAGEWDDEWDMASREQDSCSEDRREEAPPWLRFLGEEDILALRRGNVLGWEECGDYDYGEWLDEFGEHEEGNSEDEAWDHEDREEYYPGGLCILRLARSLNNEGATRSGIGPRVRRGVR